MKKIISFLFVLCFFVFALCINNKNVNASSHDDFEDFTFTAQLKLIETDKSSCVITWKTKEEIKYLNVNVILPNNFEQNPYQSGRENCAGTYVVEYIDGYYLNTLEFDIYYHQLGNIKTEFIYSYEYVIDETSEDIRVCNYVFVTGNWVEQQPLYKAVIIGLVITIFIALATYLIIENSRKNLIKPTSLDDSDVLEDDENFDPIPNRRRKVNPDDE